MGDLVAAESRHHNKGYYIPYIKCRSAPSESKTKAYKPVWIWCYHNCNKEPYTIL